MKNAFRPLVFFTQYRYLRGLGMSATTAVFCAVLFESLAQRAARELRPKVKA